MTNRKQTTRFTAIDRKSPKVADRLGRLPDSVKVEKPTFNSAV